MAKRSKASELKRLGIIPRHWDLRKKLHWTRKKIVEAKAKEYAFVLRNAENFTSRKVGKKTLKMAEESGYRVVGDRVLMPKFGADSVSINSSGVISVVKTNRAGARVRETTYLASHPGFNARLQRLLDQDEEEGIDSGKEWAFRIGDGNVFLRAHAQLATLLSYGHEVQFREPRAADYVQLVKVEYL